MSNRFGMSLILGCAAILCAPVGLADSDHKSIRADGHAPIGVMGDHAHKKGEWMFSYRYMRMEMDGNLDGDDSISDDEIAMTPNRIGPMPFLRIAPQEMTTDMHMFGLMYAPTDEVTLMLMANYLKKDMKLLTYQGMMGTNRLGTFKTRSEGIGDTKVSALIRLWDHDQHHLHLNAGISLPTGDIRQKDDVLTPTGQFMRTRLPYSMQLGSGTYDLEPGITYRGGADQWGWGAQYMGVFRIDDNDEGYALGDIHKLTTWGSYQWIPAVSSSLRLTARTQDEIDDQDSMISGPVQTADPDYYGGDFLDLGIGINLVGQHGALRGHRLAIEYNAPLIQDVNGIQMEMEGMVTAGYQYAF